MREFWKTDDPETWVDELCAAANQTWKITCKHPLIMEFKKIVLKLRNLDFVEDDLIPLWKTEPTNIEALDPITNAPWRWHATDGEDNKARKEWAKSPRGEYLYRLDIITLVTTKHEEDYVSQGPDAVDMVESFIVEHPERKMLYLATTVASWLKATLNAQI